MNSKSGILNTISESDVILKPPGGSDEAYFLQPLGIPEVTPTKIDFKLMDGISRIEN
jgi:hypothetical protein